MLVHVPNVVGLSVIAYQVSWGEARIEKAVRSFLKLCAVLDLLLAGVRSACQCTVAHRSCREKLSRVVKMVLFRVERAMSSRNSIMPYVWLS